MLGYITRFAEGQANALLAEAAEALRVQGVAVAGVVQVNASAMRGCDMDLHVLGGNDVVRISQNLGPMSQGCRLDADGLERAVGLVQARLHAGAAFLIVNKFGKQEAEGRGFRPVIGQALADGVPVLIAVADGYADAFEQFAQGIGQALDPSHDVVMEFCREALEERHG